MIGQTHNVCGTAARLLRLRSPLTPTVNPVSKATSPPPILSYIKYIASQVNGNVKGKFLFGISCFNFNT